MGYCIIQTGKNLGYAGGNNIGIKIAIENEADYICILNNDVIVERDFLEKLVKYLEKNKNTDMVGPMICEYDESNIIQSTGAMVNLFNGVITLINHGSRENEIKEKIIECDYIGGACILVRKETIDQIGLLPENYFLFFEETEWCLNAKKNGYNIICNCNAKVKHKGSASIDKVSGLSEYFMHRNRVVFEKRNANLFQLGIFYFYITLHIFYRILFKRGSSFIIKYYFDGLFNKVNEKYDFVDLPNKDIVF